MSDKQQPQHSEEQAAAEQEQPQVDAKKSEATNGKSPKSKGKKKSPKPSKEEQLKAEAAEAKDKYLRLYSEFENFRRRTAKEKMDLVSTANAGLLEKLVPILDDFERAEKSQSEQADPATLKEGMELIAQKFRSTVEKSGLKAMETEKGTDFDPDLHEAVTQFPAGDELKGKIVDTVEKGYLLGDKVVRYAKVVIGA